MAFPEATSRPLITGERMDREEFLRRWEELPKLKNAELIEGVVYVASPVGLDHAELELRMGGLLQYYAAMTAGCSAGSNGTWLMLESAPQPDLHLRRLPESGGQSTVLGKYAAGAPELAVEICVTSTDMDFGPKLALYQRAGVREYLTVETLQSRLTWRTLHGGGYRNLVPGTDGVYRSEVFPGLWLHVEAFWRAELPLLFQTVQEGIASLVR